MCLLCYATVSATEKHDVKRHFNNNHKDYDTSFPPISDIRKKERVTRKMKSYFSSLSLLFEILK
jgi:hypothetical protein